VLEGLKGYKPLFAIAIAGVESGREGFSSQSGLLEDLLNPPNWNRTGDTRIGDFPEMVTFVYQALYGSMCCATDQLPFSIKLVRTRTHVPREIESVPLIERTGVMGWPTSSLGKDNYGWKFLLDLPKNWTWLNEPFGEAEDFHVALTCYYMALNLYQLADTITTGSEIATDQRNFFPGIPVRYLGMPEHIIRKAYRLFIKNPDQVKRIWRDLGVNDETIKTFWGNWLDQCVRFHGSLYRAVIPQKNLFTDLQL